MVDLPELFALFTFSVLWVDYVICWFPPSIADSFRIKFLFVPVKIVLNNIIDSTLCFTRMIITDTQHML